MNRRSAFRSLSLIGLSATIPFTRPFAQAPSQQPAVVEPKGFKRFKLGELELTLVSDGHIIQKPVQPNFAPGVPASEVNKILTDQFRSTEEVDLAMQILLIRNGSHLIMIDSGFGAAMNTTGLLPKALSTAGFKPEDITDIVLTHGHPDHIGGVVSADGKPAFPQAKIYISKIEYDFWMAASLADFSKSELKTVPVLLKEIIKGIQKTLTAVSPQLQYFKPQDTLLNCIRLVSAPGHTPGLTLMNVFSGDQQLLHLADLIHSDVLLFPHPEWGYFGDTDLQLASKSRREILERLSNDKMLALGYHLPWPGLGHVRKKDAAFEWVPEVYATP